MLPIRTNRFDRLFIGAVLYVALHLLWMRFLEAWAPLWMCTALSLALAVWLFRRG